MKEIKRLKVLTLGNAFEAHQMPKKHASSIHPVDWNLFLGVQEQSRCVQIVRLLF